MVIANSPGLFWEILFWQLQLIFTFIFIGIYWLYARKRVTHSLWRQLIFLYKDIEIMESRGKLFFFEVFVQITIFSSQMAPYCCMCHVTLNNISVTQDGTVSARKCEAMSIETFQCFTYHPFPPFSCYGPWPDPFEQTKCYTCSGL